MKKFAGIFLVVIAVAISSCGGGNEPNLDDAASVAKYNCEKQKEVIELIKAEVPDEAKITKLSEEVEAMDKKLEEHHGDKLEAFKTKVAEEMKKQCPNNSFE